MDVDAIVLLHDLVTGLGLDPESGQFGFVLRDVDESAAKRLRIDLRWKARAWCLTRRDKRGGMRILRTWPYTILDPRADIRTALQHAVLTLRTPDGRSPTGSPRPK